MSWLIEVDCSILYRLNCCGRMTKIKEILCGLEQYISYCLTKAPLGGLGGIPRGKGVPGLVKKKTREVNDYFTSLRC